MLVPMTDSGDELRPRSTRTDRSARPAAGRRPAGALLAEVCPYLLSADGAWRAAQPTRDHRCAATQPPAELAVAKQRALCLAGAHVTCATYRAARQVEADAEPEGGGAEAGGLWPAPRTTLLALEPVHARTAIPGTGGRIGGQVILVGLMVVALVVLVVARTTPSGGPNGSGASGSPGASAVALASPTPSPSIAATESPSPSSSSSAAPGPTPKATPKATKKPKPSPTVIPANAKTYKVKSGDTLSGIASRYGITVKALKAANGLKDNIIHVGQVLVIP
jgi:LysM repeat protein